MYTRDEKKVLRKQYWSQFKVYSNRHKIKAGKPGKWIMNETGIKQLKLKFYFDKSIAWAGIEINTRNLDKRIELFDKIEKLKTILTTRTMYELEWELEVFVDDSKSVSRVYSKKEGVNIYNKSCWKEVNEFLYSTMEPIEGVFLEYSDFIRNQTS